MSLLCGIDFGPASAGAADVAARLALRLKVDLLLAHVVDVQAPPSARSAAALALEHEVERVRGHGGRISVRLLEGRPEQELARVAAELDATALVIASPLRAPGAPTSGTDASRDSGAALRTSADRIAQACEQPVILIRDPQPFLLWLQGLRHLKALVAVDRTEASKDAVRFAALLRSAAPVDLSLLRVYWAPEENRRFGYLGVRNWLEADPKVEQLLLHELEEEIGEIGGAGEVRSEVALTVGRAAERIVEHAAREGADLLIVGSHRRNLLERLWLGSTSRHVLRDAPCSTAIVTGRPRAPAQEIPRFGSVLVATDFSDAGDGAVRWARALVPPGGVIHIVHVKAPPPGTAPGDLFETPPAAAAGELTSLQRMLLERGAAEGSRQGVHTEAHVLWSTSVPDALLQAGQRLGVDALVLGTRGKSPARMAVLGSVAQDVAARSQRPVLLVHSPTR
jgi:nucleotide-binding universal stress UspA family protein